MNLDNLTEDTILDDVNKIEGSTTAPMQPAAPTEQPSLGGIMKDELTTGEDVSFGEGVADVGMGFVRGGLSFGQSIYDLSDLLVNDMLPDIDIRSFAGENKTIAGSLTEGMTQFMLGFLPAVGLIGKAGQVAAGAGKAAKAAKFAKYLTVAKKGNMMGKMRVNFAGDVVAGSVSDFVSFKGQEERLSNLLEMHPSLKNPVTDYLSYHEGDGEIEGRFKNVIEGLLMEAGMTAVLKSGFLKSLDIMKAGKKDVLDGQSVNDVVDIDAIKAEADAVGVIGRDNLEVGGLKDSNSTTKSADAEPEAFKSNVWEPEETPEGYKSLPFTPMRDKPNQEINPARGVDKMMSRLNKEWESGKINLTKEEVKNAQKFFDLVGDEPFSDVALSFTNRLEGSALFDFSKGVAEIGNGVVSSGRFEPTFFHEMWHAASRSLNEKDLADNSKAYLKARKSYEKTDPVFAEVAKLTKNFEGREITNEAYEAMVKKHGEAISSRFKPSGKKNMTFFFHDDNYRFQNSDEWFAESMKDAVMGRLDKDAAPAGSMGKVFEGMSEYVKSVYNAIKRELGFDPTEDFLNKFIQRKRSSIQSNSTMGDDVFGGLREMPELPSGKSRDAIESINEEIEALGLDLEFASVKEADVIQSKISDLEVKIDVLKQDIEEGIGVDKTTQPNAAEAKAVAGVEAATKSAVESVEKRIKPRRASTVGKNLGKTLMEGTQGGRAIQNAPIKTHILPSTIPEMAGAIKGVMKVLAEEGDKVGSKSNAQSVLEAELGIENLAKIARDNDIGMADAVALAHKDILQSEGAGFIHTVNVMLNIRQDELSDLSVKLIDLSDKSNVEELTEVAAQLATMLDDYANMMAIRSLVASGAGSQLQAVTAKAFVSAKQINLTPDMIKDVTLRNEYMSMAGKSPEDMKKVADLIKELKGAERLEDGILQGIVKSYSLGDLAKDAHSFRINALLSGAKTFSMNGVGAVAMMGLRSTSQAVGALMVGDTSIAKAIFEAQMKAFDDMHLITTFKNTFKEGKSDFEGAGGANFSEHDLDNSASFFWNYIVNAPTRGLMGADAAMKQYAFSARARVKAASDAMAKGMNPKEVSEYVDKAMDAMLTNEGRLNNPHNMQKEKIQSLRDSGKWDSLTRGQKRRKRYEAKAESTKQLGKFGTTQEYSLESANKDIFMQEPEGAAGKINKGLNAMPEITKVIIPFRRTPINVIATGLDYAFAPMNAAVGKFMPDAPFFKAAKDKLLENYRSKDPLVAAEARGKLAVSMSAWTVAWTAITTNAEMITGGGSSDHAERKRMEETGWQKYSIKVGDKYYSYQRMDPLAMIIGLAADLREGTNDPARDVQKTSEVIGGIALTALSQNVLDKSFLVGLDGFIKAVGDEDMMEKWVRNFAGSFVPSAISQTAEIATGKPMQAEVWDMMDAITKRTILGAGGLDPKRNILGEKLTSQELDSITDRMFDVVANVSEDKDDVVLEEIASLRQGFDIPSKNVGGLNLTEFDMPDGKTAYNYYRKMNGTVKIGGRNLRSALDKVIRSNWYQNINPKSYGDFKTARIKELQKVIRKYKNKALVETLNANPELEMHYNANNLLKREHRSGTDVFKQAEALIQSQQ